MREQPPEAGAVRGLEIIALGAVIGLVQSVVMDLYHRLAEPSVGSNPWGSMALASMLVGLIHLALRVWGLVALARLPDMVVAKVVITMDLAGWVMIIAVAQSGSLLPRSIFVWAVGAIGVVGFAATLLTVVVLHRASQRLGGNLGSMLAGVLYLWVAARLVVYLAVKTLRSFQLEIRSGDVMDYSAMQEALRTTGELLQYGYSLLLLVALVRLIRSVKHARVSPSHG